MLNLRARIVPGLLLAAASLLGPAAGAHADVSISVAPSLVELNATPGGTGTVELTVLNEGDEAFELTAGIDQYKDGSGDRSAVDWLSVEPPAFTLAPGQQLQVRVHVAVPTGVSAGGRYGLVVFRTAAAGASGSRVGVSGQVGVPLLMDVQAGDALVRDADIKRLVPILEPTGGLGFWAELQNRGNVHVTSRGGAVDVTRADGSNVGRLDLPESTAILPASSEPLLTDASVSFEPDAVYHASGTLAYGGAAPAAADVGFTAHADLSLTDLATSDAAGSGTAVSLGLSNTGELGLLPQIDLSVRDAAGRTVQTASPPRPPLLLPGQTAEIQTQLPDKLSPGSYTLIARAQYPGDAREREVAFSIGAGSGMNNTHSADSTAARPVATNPVSSADSAQIGSARTMAIALVSLLGLVALAGVLWLPALAPLRRRFRRAARSFAESD